jgi:N-acyl-D-amino-acid deacylase
VVRAAAWGGLLLGASAPVWIGVAVAATPADFLIRGGMVYTGADAPPLNGDVVIAGEQILYVGADGGTRYSAREIVNAQGKIVAPGFIDAHAHPDTYVRSPDP